MTIIKDQANKHVIQVDSITQNVSAFLYSLQSILLALITPPNLNFKENISSTIQPVENEDLQGHQLRFRL